MRLVVLCLLFVACGNPTLLDGKTYSKECTTSSDCVGIFLGNQCEPCACPNAAISTGDKILYEADRSAAIAACGERIAIGCGPCPERRPSCNPLASPTSDSTQRFCEL